jgi:ADP-heptose:LPS heptosyltransferase/predicted SAM-dependent methyltransferase
MTWHNDPARNRAYTQGESVKIAWELVPYTRGVGLELGCGAFKAFPHFIGLDAAPAPGAGGPQLVMDCRDLSAFASGAFDFVFSSHLLEHIEDTRATLAEWWRLIEVGGHLVLYLPHRQFYPNIGEPGGNPDHKHDFLPGDIVEAMADVAPDWDLVENQARNDADEYSFFQVFRKLPEGAGQVLGFRAAKPAKRAAVFRPGAYGDVIWSSSITWHLKRQGYHVTVYTGDRGEEVLRHDPNVDRIIAIGEDQIPEGFLAKFILAESTKYDHAVNLVESVERNALGWPTDIRFFWPDEVRRKTFNRNYLELVHDLAGVPHEFHQKFYATDEEMAAARIWRAAHCGAAPMIVLAPTGSTPPKFWPHVEALAAALSAAGAHLVVLGDLRGLELPAMPGLHCIGMGYPIREAIALALCADIVIGQETAILNAVAMEPMRKIVLLSHSTVQNLTRHWVNTVSMYGRVPCYPCHRIHQTFEHCTRDPASGTAACQSAISAEQVLQAVQRALPSLQAPVAA